MALTAVASPIKSDAIAETVPLSQVNQFACPAATTDF